MMWDSNIELIQVIGVTCTLVYNVSLITNTVKSIDQRVGGQNLNRSWDLEWSGKFSLEGMKIEEICR